ncbi:MAG: metalloregulator ArsR/SmtB family transcription factor [Phycisphaerales bacterium]|nr:metalloregulator ArsR/SmtB family transcription factor [Phycisphaerales bacterium]
MDDAVIHEQTARLAHAFANPLRVRILDLLVHRERSVDEIRLSVSAPVTSVSSHLKVLREARLVETRRDGVKIYYRIADDSVVSALTALRHVGEARSLEVREVVRQFLQDEAAVTPVGVDDLMRMMHDGEAVLIDVRPRDEFESGHIPGAISVPLDDLEEHVASLKRDAHIVAYCRDTYCVLAPKAAKALQQFGLNTDRLDIGFTEWSAQGRPVVHGENETEERIGA